MRGLACLCGAMAVGAFASSLWLDRHATTEEAETKQRPRTTFSRFVQEPEGRTSFRPSLRPRTLGADLSRPNQRVNRRVLNVFREAVGANWKSAVRVLSKGEQVALGTVVADDGWIVTKASQLPDSGPLRCRLWDDREIEGNVVSLAPDVDLALLRIQAENLPTCNWGQSLPQRGNWVATADIKQTPTAIGVVSTGIQKIPAEKSVLGVELTNSTLGAAVSHVLLGTGAFDAGLRRGDSIFQVNGIEVKTLESFRRAITGSRGGDIVHLMVNRADQKFPLDARLMDLTEELLDDTEMEVNGRVSARATGFERVFLHDTVLSPNQCGGPLVSLDGEIVGINIARAGRVTSYALPADVVRPLVDSLITEAKLVSAPDKAVVPASATVR